MEKPKAAGNSPQMVQLESGKTYACVSKVSRPHSVMVLI